MNWWRQRSRLTKGLIIAGSIILVLALIGGGEEPEDVAAVDAISSPTAQPVATATPTPLPATPSPTPSPVDACNAAFAKAAAVDAMRDSHEDMDPAFTACVTFADFAAASERHPNALDGAAPRTYARNRCQYSENAQVRESGICEEVAAD